MSGVDEFAILQRYVLDDDVDKLESYDSAVISAATDASSRTLAYFARTLTTIRFLHNAGCQLDHIDKFGHSPLHSAVADDLVDVATYIAAADAALVNRPSTVAGVCPIQFAASVDMIQAFSRYGADLFAADHNGDTLLHHCARIGRHSLIEQIIRSRGAVDVNILNGVGRTPLHNAAECGHHQIMQTLIAHGADIDSRDIAGWSPLHCASLGAWPQHESHRICIEILLRCGADVNALETSGLTPLHVCTDTPAARVLVAAEQISKPQTSTANGRFTTPRTKTQCSHNNSAHSPCRQRIQAVTDCVADLVRLISVFCSRAVVSLSQRISRCGHRCIRVRKQAKSHSLITHGCHLNALDTDKRTPLDWALITQRHDVAEFAI